MWDSMWDLTWDFTSHISPSRHHSRDLSRSHDPLAGLSRQYLWKYSRKIIFSHVALYHHNAAFSVLETTTHMSDVENISKVQPAKATKRRNLRVAERMKLIEDYKNGITGSRANTSFESVEHRWRMIYHQRSANKLIQTILQTCLHPHHRKCLSRLLT